MKTPGRNDPCPCGSGKKYKRCCALTGGFQPSETVSPLETSRPSLWNAVSGGGQRELTDALISELSERWGCPRGDLETMRDEGASYNPARDSIVFPPEVGGPVFES